jgi:hypothetical protein
MKKLFLLTAVGVLMVYASGCRTCNWFHRGAPARAVTMPAPIYGDPCAPIAAPCDPCAPSVTTCAPSVTTCAPTAPVVVAPGPETYVPAPGR